MNLVVLGTLLLLAQMKVVVVFSFTIICLFVRNFYRIRTGSIIHSSWHFLVFRHKFPAIPKCTQTIPFVGLSRVYDKAVLNK